VVAGTGDIVVIGAETPQAPPFGFGTAQPPIQIQFETESPAAQASRR
jgi:hypothetical protein